MSTPSPATTSRWRNRTFVATFAVAAIAWLAFFGWVAWHYFPLMLNWVERQHAILQELLGGLLVIAWALFLGAGAGAAVVIADRVAGTRHLPDPGGQTHGQHAAWQRPDRS
jgi:hypothetical protein